MPRWAYVAQEEGCDRLATSSHDGREVLTHGPVRFGGHTGDSRGCDRPHMIEWVNLDDGGEETIVNTSAVTPTRTPVTSSADAPPATSSRTQGLSADERWRRLVIKIVGIRRVQEHFYGVGVFLQQYKHDILLCISHQYGYRLEEKRANDGRPEPPSSMRGGPRRASGERARLEAERRR